MWALETMWIELPTTLGMNPPAKPYVMTRITFTSSPL